MHDIFRNWLCELDGAVRRKKRKTILFLDNCAPHTKAVEEVRLSNVRGEWLLADSSSVTQPMHQGAIRRTKAAYRCLVLQRMIAAIDGGKDFAVISIKHVIYFLHSPSESVCQATMQKFSPCRIPSREDNYGGGCYMYQ